MNFLPAWFELEDNILKAKRPMEAAFIAMNMSHSVVVYRQAALWNSQDGIISMSGVALVEKNAPYVLWLHKVFQHLDSSANVQFVEAIDLPSSLAEQWGDWLPAYVLIIPAGEEALLFARDDPFQEIDVELLKRLAALTSVTRLALTPKRLSIPWFKGRKKWLAALLAICAMFFPVTGSILAPAESVPVHPVIIRAPLDGVIDIVTVKPNEEIKEGQPLFALNATSLSGRLDIARQQLATAEAEYRQVAQAMVFDPKSKSQAVILASKAEEKAAEIRLLESQLARINVKSPIAGIAVFNDLSDWVGRPVLVGEKVMMVSNGTDTEIEAWVSVSDIGEVRLGGEMTFFLNTAPLSPLKAQVRTIAYESSVRPDSTIAHKIRATLTDEDDKPRLGLKGTARVDGDTIPLVWWAFRRPLGAIRQFIGF